MAVGGVWIAFSGRDQVRSEEAGGLVERIAAETRAMGSGFSMEQARLSMMRSRQQGARLRPADGRPSMDRNVPRGGRGGGGGSPAGAGEGAEEAAGRGKFGGAVRIVSRSPTIFERWSLASRRPRRGSGKRSSGRLEKRTEQERQELDAARELGGGMGDRPGLGREARFGPGRSHAAQMGGAVARPDDAPAGRRDPAQDGEAGGTERGLPRSARRGARFRQACDGAGRGVAGREGRTNSEAV